MTVYRREGRGFEVGSHGFLGGGERGSFVANSGLNEELIIANGGVIKVTSPGLIGGSAKSPTPCLRR